MHNLNWKKIDQVEKVDQRVAPGTAWHYACCKERKGKKGQGAACIAIWLFIFYFFVPMDKALYCQYTLTHTYSD